MKILELKSNNIKRIKAVELQLDKDQNVVMITGRNGQGKSSILDSIWYALGGAKIVPGQPIRKGTDHAEIELTLEDYVVTRTFTENGTYLKVENKEGAKYSNPQQLLDKLIGQLSFDPLEFSRLEPKKQVAQLIALTGLDFSDLDTKKKELSEERVIVGRELKTTRPIEPDELESAKVIWSKEELSVAELSTQLQEALSEHEAYARNKATRDSIASKIEETKQQLAKLENDLAEVSKTIVEPTSNPDSIRAKIEGAEKLNNQIREAGKIVEQHDLRTDKQTTYDKLTADIDGIEAERQTRLAGAKMPIEGLAFTDEAILYNTIPFDQLSAAEQLKVSMAMAMVANPKLRVILIRDGSLLDKDNLKVIQELAVDMDFQVWIEAVDDSGKVGVYIEDGEIKTNNNAETTAAVPPASV